MIKDKTNIPAYNEMMQELFQAIKELGGSGTIQEIDDKTIEILGLSPDILTVMHGDSSKSEVEYRLAWTRTYMKKVGILENSTRGVWALTTSGRELQAINSEEIVKKVREMTFLKAKDVENLIWRIIIWRMMVLIYRTKFKHGVKN